MKRVSEMTVEQCKVKVQISNLFEQCKPQMRKILPIGANKNRKIYVEKCMRGSKRG